MLNHKGSLQLAKMPEPTTQGLYAELCYGTLRQFPRLNLRLGKLLKKKLKSQDADVRALLLIGLYQLEFMRIPDHAILDQTVEASNHLGKAWARGLTNAILRNAQRRTEELTAELSGQTEFDTALPAWLYKQWQQSWPEQLDQIVATANQYPPMTLRVNLQQQSREDYRRQLADQDITSEPGQLSPSALRLAEPISVNALPGFFQGAASVQDEAAQLCAPLLQLAPGQRVLDACAAPGGKTGHLLETCSEIELTAMDLSAKRLTDVQSNLDRLGLSASLVAEDAANTPKWWDQQAFDRILLDAPCSGTGVIRRHPDIKVLRRPADIDSFCQQQRRLLDSLWPLLAENGLLLYVTCSIMPAENEAQIEAFVARHPDVQAQALPVDWGLELARGRQLLPGCQGADGFYFALLKKCSPS